MRSLKRPLSILIAALMLVSIMVIAPVTASAEGENPSVTVEKWVKGQIRENSALYKFPDLFENFKFVRMTKNAEPSWGHVVDDNQTANLSLSGKGNTDTYRLQSWSGHTINGTWYDYGNVTDGIYIDAADNGTEIFAHETVDWYAWTWETFSLTEHSAVYGVNGNLKYYTDGLSDNRYFVEDGTSYKEVDRSDVFFDYVTTDGEGINYDGELTRDSGDPLNNSEGFSGAVKNLEILGVQERTVDDAAAFRFVTIANSALLSAADDYGYIMASTDMEKDAAMAAISDSNFYVGGNNNKKYSCKGTSNDFAGDYGTADLTATGYKYISCIVTGAGSGNVVVSRFYITLNGITYTYAKYGSNFGCAYALS